MQTVPNIKTRLHIFSSHMNCNSLTRMIEFAIKVNDQFVVCDMKATKI